MDTKNDYVPSLNTIKCVFGFAMFHTLTLLTLMLFIKTQSIILGVVVLFGNFITIITAFLTVCTVLKDIKKNF